MKAISIAVAVSGGVDSLYALLSLRNQGHHVMALHARFLNTAHDPVPGLTKECANLGIPLHVVDLRQEFFAKVIQPFIAAHELAQTPNPCALCNRAMKFGMLLQHAEALGAEALSTGHYVALDLHPVYGASQGLLLCQAEDKVKDQSYFLALTPIQALQKCQFPLAKIHKEQARQYIKAHGLEVPLPTESQEICFVPQDDHLAFLQASKAKLGPPGPITISHEGQEKTLGQHFGLWRYTEGQRRGLGIAWSEGLYVVSKNRSTNTLIVGGQSQLKSHQCIGLSPNFMVAPHLWPKELFVRCRYRQQPVPAQVEICQNADTPQLICHFLEAQTPVAPGQVLAIYDAKGFVLAGAVLA